MSGSILVIGDPASWPFTITVTRVMDAVDLTTVAHNLPESLVHFSKHPRFLRQNPARRREQ